MKAKIALITILFGFLIGIPYIVVGREYFVLLFSLSFWLIALLVVFTIAAGLFIEGFLRKAFARKR